MDLLVDLKKDVMYPLDVSDGAGVYVGDHGNTGFPLFISLSEYPAHISIKSENGYLKNMLSLFKDMWGNDISCKHLGDWDSAEMITVESLKKLLSSRLKILLDLGYRDAYSYETYTGKTLQKIIVICDEPSLDFQEILYELAGLMPTLNMHFVVHSKLLIPKFRRKMHATVEIDNTSGLLVIGDDYTPLIVERILNN